MGGKISEEEERVFGGKKYRMGEGSRNEDTA